jgi:hypothetical protein
MGRTAVARNDLCPCGSGRKFKRCCLAADQRAAREARFEEAVARRLQDWVSATMGDELGAALDEFAGSATRLDEADLDVFAAWFHNDRESEGAIRWDLLLARVMPGDPPTFWGPVRIVSPAEEPELRAELDRLAGSPPGERALALLRFDPPSRSAGPSFFTREGDPIAFAIATWRVHDAAAAAERLRQLARLEPGDPLVMDVTVPRATIQARRHLLPPGAVVLDSGPAERPEDVSIATVGLEGDELRAETRSEPRLAQAIRLVTADFAGLLAELRSVEIETVEEARARPHAEAPGAPVSPAAVGEEQLLRRVLEDHLRCWLDEPHPDLAGRTPREAAAGGDGVEVARLVRLLENGTERSRRSGGLGAGIDVEPLRRELGLRDDLAA